MAVAVSLGRSQGIREADIAQEELQQAGTFSMRSVQNAIYLLSPRSVELFRRANVEADDILTALGMPIEFEESEPLLETVMRRISSDDLDCSDQHAENQANCQRIQLFLNLIEPIQSRDKEATDCKLIGMPIRIAEVIRDGAPPRPLLSHALTGGHGSVAAALIRRCGGVNPEVSILVGPSDPSRASAEGEPLNSRYTEAQAHIRAVLDPHLAVMDGSRVRDGQWTPDEARRVHNALCEEGIKFKGLFGTELPKGYEKCKDQASSSQENAPDTAYLVNISGNTCRTENYRIKTNEKFFKLETRQRGGSSSNAQVDIGNSKLSGWTTGGEFISQSSDRSISIVLQRLLSEEAAENGLENKGRTRLVMQAEPLPGATDILHAYGWVEDPHPGLWSAANYALSEPADKLAWRGRLYMWSNGVEYQEGASYEGSDDKGFLWRVAFDEIPLVQKRIQLKENGAIRFTSPQKALPEENGCLVVYQNKDVDRREPIHSLTVRAGQVEHGESPQLPKGDYRMELTMLEPNVGEFELTMDVYKKPWSLHCSFDAKQSEPPTDKSVTTLALPDGEASFHSESAQGRELVCDFLLSSNERRVVLNAEVSSVSDTKLDLRDAASKSLLGVMVGNEATGSEVVPAIKKLQQVIPANEKYQLVIQSYEETFDEQPISVMLRLSEIPELALGEPLKIAEPIPAGGRAELNYFVKKPGFFKVTLDELDADLDLEIQHEGTDITSSINPEDDPDIACFYGENGAYVIEVFSAARRGSSYRIHIENLINSELKLGEPVSTDIEEGSKEYYLLHIPDEGVERVQVRLDGLDDDLDLAIYRDNVEIERSFNMKTDPEVVEFEVMSGSYVVEVISLERSSPYSLVADRFL